MVKFRMDITKTAINFVEDNNNNVGNDGDDDDCDEVKYCLH